MNFLSFTSTKPINKYFPDVAERVAAALDYFNLENKHSLPDLKQLAQSTDNINNFLYIFNDDLNQIPLIEKKSLINLLVDFWYNIPRNEYKGQSILEQSANKFLKTSKVIKKKIQNQNLKLPITGSKPIKLNKQDLKNNDPKHKETFMQLEISGNLLEDLFDIIYDLDIKNIHINLENKSALPKHIKKTLDKTRTFSATKTLRSVSLELCHQLYEFLHNNQQTLNAASINTISFTLLINKFYYYTCSLESTTANINKTLNTLLQIIRLLKIFSTNINENKQKHIIESFLTTASFIKDSITINSN